MAIGKQLPVRSLGSGLPGTISPRVPNVGFQSARLPFKPTNVKGLFRADFIFDQEVRAYQRISDTVNKKIDSAYMYIATRIRQAARKSIRKSSKREPHSRPGTPVKTPANSRIYPDTIYRHYDKRTKIMIVGPKTTKNLGAMPDGSRNMNGQTIPNLLEYGGVIYSPRPTFVHRDKAPPAALNAYWKRERARRYGGKRKPRGKKAFLKRDVKWVVIPKGYRIVDPRPTMRLAQNKVLNYKSLKYAFERIGVPNPNDIKTEITGLRV